jgi:GT2 family glycosyltransferase/glycosyltransferase involved in cell wall biosynthesis
VQWSFRQQRPQQMARQFAYHGHRGFYADLEFHRRSSAELREVQPRLFEMKLPGNPKANPYRHSLEERDVERVLAAIRAVRREQGIAAAVLVVQLPFWTPLALRLRKEFGWPIVYDCMDDHAAFSTNDPAMFDKEQGLVASADLVVTTSELLHAKVEAHARRTALVRNGCDYTHFADVSVPAACPRPVVGYYGAIADWFDSDLVADLAASRPGWEFELVGSTYTGDISRLERLPNVRLLGEKPYGELPQLVARWDCFLIPFKLTPLTEATNPVKAYEMLATGRPVVATRLPELTPLAEAGLVALADDAAGLSQAVEQELKEDNGERRERRRAFAARNTWKDRYDELAPRVRELFPLASVVVLTYNNLALNRLCLQSIFERTDWPNFEVIVVDNASTDGTAEWLQEYARREPRLKVLCNADNRGYSAGNNQGLALARGEYLCLLNNDTVVTHGWLSTLIGHLRARPTLGLVGPVSNAVGNDAMVPVGYQNVEDVPAWAAGYCREHHGETFPLPMLGFFCVAMPRTVFEKVGMLDETFGIGNFEDDDFCHRVRLAGYELLCARDSFVHHWHRSSFKLLGEEESGRIFAANKQVFETKWGVRWESYDPKNREAA